MTTHTPTRPLVPARPRARGPNVHATFLREFIRNPGATAAIAPSSRKLCQRMVEDVDFSRVSSIVEYGPGSGVITRVVMECLPRGWMDAVPAASTAGQGKFVAIEFNPTMVEVVRGRFPQITVVNDSAANVEAISAQHGITPGTLDLVVSGLGWSSFPPEVTTQILEATVRVLKPGGEFRTFAYHIGLLKRSAWHLRAEMQRLFTDVRTTRSVWANLPPAFVYVCRK